MRLIDIETEIKELIAIDIEKPIVYQKIYDLVYFYLKRRRLLCSEQDFEDVSHIGATDMYLKVYQGGVIHSWIGYLSIAYRGYIREYRKLYRSEIIDTGDNEELKNSIALMSAASCLQNHADYDTVLIRDYIDNILKTVDYVMNSSFYLDYTSDYYNARLTILISILNGKFTPYGRLKESEKIYTHMLFARVQEKITQNIGCGTFNQADVLAQYTLETLETDNENNNTDEQSWG